jgi:hypothetical protein
MSLARRFFDRACGLADFALASLAMTRQLSGSEVGAVPRKEHGAGIAAVA